MPKRKAYFDACAIRGYYTCPRFDGELKNNIKGRCNRNWLFFLMCICAPFFANGRSSHTSVRFDCGERGGGSSVIQMRCRERTLTSSLYSNECQQLDEALVSSFG